MRNKIINEYEKYLKYSINLCNRYIYNSYKLKKKLLSKKVSIPTVNKIIITLNKYNLINDKSLILSLIEEMIFNYYGLRRIKERLITLNFNESDIESCLNDIDLNIIKHKLEEYMCKNKPKDIISIKKRNKFINHCLRRGYDINDIKSYLI